jgi:purine-cytosine permease-like protein
VVVVVVVVGMSTLTYLSYVLPPLAGTVTVTITITIATSPPPSPSYSMRSSSVDGNTGLSPEIIDEHNVTA